MSAQSKSSLYNLNVSQFLAFVFFAASLTYEILILNKGLTSSALARFWNPPLLIILVFLNGIRIFLASWETEEDHFHFKIINHTFDSTTKKSYKRVIDWWLRLIWLFAVYLLPFLIHFSNNSFIIAIWIPIYFLVLYGALLFWDIKILQWIREYRTLKTPGQLDEEINDIDSCKPTFGDIYNLAFKKYDHCNPDKNKRGKREWNLKKFEQKTVLWQAIDVSCLFGFMIYCIIIGVNYYYYNLKDDILLTISLYLLCAIIFSAFTVEFLFNLKAYYRRFLWSMFFTLFVGFGIYFIHLYVKTSI